MADVVEKQQLLKDIKFLIDLINNAKQRDADIESRQGLSGKRAHQKPESDTFNQNVEVPKHSSSCHGHYEQQPQPSNLTAITNSNMKTTSAQQALSSKGWTNINIPHAKREIKMETCMAGLSKEHPSTSTVVQACSDRAIKASKQSEMNLDSGCSGKSSSDVKALTTLQIKHPPQKQSSVQSFTKKPATLNSSTRIVVDLKPTGNKLSTSQAHLRTHPSRVGTSSHTSFSSRKDELISKSAQVTAAREIMQDKLDGLKLYLARLEAAKKKQTQATSSHHHHITSSVKTKTRSKSTESGKELKTALRKKDHEASQNEKTVNKQQFAAASSIGSAQQSTKQLLALDKKSSQTMSAGEIAFVNTNKPESVKTHTVAVRQNSNPLKTTKRPDTAKTTELRKTLVSSKSSKIVTPDTPQATVSVKNKEKPVVSGSAKTSSTVADLEKELKATQDKLFDMRRRMGVMLKESPKKLNTVKSIASHQQTAELLTVSVAAAMHGTMPRDGHFSDAGSPKSMPMLNVKQRPIPNRTSLRWTPQTSPCRQSSETLVVSSSPSVRFSQKPAYKPRSSKLKQSSVYLRPSSQTTFSKNNPAGRKSRFSLKRNHNTNSGIISTGSSPALKNLGGQQSPSGSAFVDTYKLRRHHANPPGKFAVKSRYKLVKTSAKEMSGLQQVTWGHAVPRTASQRAAKVIKSKYKIRTLPLPAYPDLGSLRKKQEQFLPSHWKRKTRARSISQEFAVKNRNKMLNSGFLYSWSNKFPFGAFTAAGKGRYPGKQGRGANSAMYFYGGYLTGEPRSQGFSKRWLTSHSHRRTFSHQQSAWERAKAIAAWKRQLKMNLRTAGIPYNYWQVKSHQALVDKLQKRLLLKRLQWRKRCSLTRQQMSSRRNSPTKSRTGNSRQEQLVMINGILYKSSSKRLTKASSSASKLATSASLSAAASHSRMNNSVVVRNVKRHKMQTVTVRGISFKVDSRGTKLCRVQAPNTQDKVPAVSRVDVGGVTYVETKEGVLEKISDSQTRSVINRVKQRSIARVTAKFRKNNIKGSKKNCLFYSRFGKCSRGESCPYLHDPEKIAVCTRFLRGTCKVENCPFSHKVAKEKMPVCAFFLRGVCTRENCPYLHVKVSQGAEICKDFVSGFCPLAEKCQKVHTLTCPHFAKTGACPEGKKCRLLHRRINTKQKQRMKTPVSVHPVDCSTEASSITQPPQQLIIHEDRQQNVATLQLDGSPNPEGDGETETQESCSEEPKSVATASVCPQKKLGMKGTIIIEDSSGISCAEADEKRASAQKPAKLPAFISLADYSLEESPVLRKASRTMAATSTSTQRKNKSELQIKPRIQPPETLGC